MPNARNRPQQAFDEEPLDKPELAALLARRDEAAVQLAPVKKAYDGLDKQAKAMIEQAELANGSYRCGGYVITIKPTESREVSFERSASKRITISPAK